MVERAVVLCGLCQVELLSQTEQKCAGVQGQVGSTEDVFETEIS